MIPLEKKMTDIENLMKNLVADDDDIMKYYKKWVDARIEMVEYVREQTRIVERQQYKGEV